MDICSISYQLRNSFGGHSFIDKMPALLYIEIEIKGLYLIVRKKTHMILRKGQKMIKKSSVIAWSFMALIASGDQTEFKLLDNEYWWGGHSFNGRSMPYSAEKSFKDNLINNNSYNQTSGFLLSSKGRWLWNDEPFSFEFKPYKDC